MTEFKKFDSHLGIAGWFGGGRWGVERYLYIAHRLAGLGILLFFMMHIFESSLRVFGPETWNAAMKTLEHPFFKTGEFLLFCGFAFHALNGVRLILVELGFAVGEAEEPVYPYQTSLNVQRPLMLVVMVLAAILILTGGVNFFFLN